MNYLQTNTKGTSCLQSRTTVERGSKPLYKRKLNKLIAYLLFICLAHLTPLFSNAQFCNQSGIGLGNVIAVSQNVSNKYINGN
jgi:hypothetical protein